MQSLFSYQQTLEAIAAPEHVPARGASKLLCLETSTLRRPMLLVAPRSSDTIRNFDRIVESSETHVALMREVQRLRGRLYLADGAITEDQLTPDGRFVQAVDADSWHLAIFDQQGELAGCTRFRPHKPGVRFQDLGVYQSALAHSDTWGYRLQAAVEAEIELARERGVAYVELGGWALAPGIRFTSEAMKMVLYQYGLAQVLGGALGISTATTRHHSSSILRRIGGQALSFEGESLPAYFDPHYGCEMEVLRFDSEQPNPKYMSWIDDCRAQLACTPVLTSSTAFHHSLESLKRAVEPGMAGVRELLPKAS